MSLAIVAGQPGGPDVLKLTEVEDPVAGAGRLLIRVAASGVNFIETYQRNGTYSVSFPFIPGTEASGTVLAVGTGVEGFAVGDRVVSGESRNTYAELALVDADKTFHVPDGVSAETAAGLLAQGMTAHYLANSTFPAQEGQTVLVHAAAGGVGLLLTQLLKAKGVRVIATVSDDAKEGLARKAGAETVLRYEGFAEQVLALTGGDGVDCVYDGVGKATFDGSLASVKVRGMLVLFGASSGPVPPFEIQRLNAGGSVFLTRPTMAHYLRTPEERAWRAGDIFSAVLSGELDVRIGAT